MTTAILIQPPFLNIRTYWFSWRDPTAPGRYMCNGDSDPYNPADETHLSDRSRWRRSSSASAIDPDAAVADAGQDRRHRRRANGEADASARQSAAARHGGRAARLESRHPLRRVRRDVLSGRGGADRRGRCRVRRRRQHESRLQARRGRAGDHQGAAHRSRSARSRVSHRRDSR